MIPFIDEEFELYNERMKGMKN